MRKILHINLLSILINIFIVFFLFIGMQNSKETRKVYFLNYETIEMPIAFIAGMSFILGTLCGNIISSINIYEKK